MKILIGLALLSSAFGASISTITCAGGIATVNVANTLVASQGFEITGSTVSSYNVNGAAVSANSTSFTFSVPCNGTGTGGVYVPAPQLLVQSMIPIQGTGNLQATEIFWNTTTTPTAKAGFVSAWPSATAAQTAALQAGYWIESVQSFNISVNASAASLLTLVTTLYSTIQTALNSQYFASIGFCYNGSTWNTANCN